MDKSAVTTPVIEKVETEGAEDLAQEFKERIKSPPSVAPRSERGNEIAQSREEIISTSKSYMQAP